MKPHFEYIGGFREETTNPQNRKQHLTTIENVLDFFWLGLYRHDSMKNGTVYVYVLVRSDLVL